MEQEQENEVEKRPLLRENDTIKFWWDLIILGFAIFNSVFIPMTLSFDEIDDTMRNNLVYNIIDQIANVFYFVDIFLGFNTSYYDDFEGDEIFDKKKIIRHYFFGKFSIDFLSSLPIDQFFPGSPFRIINMLKIVRIQKLK